MNRAFWNNKKVLVTGHTGFKGSWLSLWLHSAGAELTGYALDPPTMPNAFTDISAGTGMTSVIGDILDTERLKKTIAACRPEIIIHMAAQSVVRTSYENPVETFATNVMGTVNLLEAVRTSGGVRVLVNVTSDKCYANTGLRRGYRETDPLGGHDPYSSSKACSELVTSAYRRSYFSGDAAATAVATARAGNVIGGGDWTKDQLVPDIVRALLAHQPIRLRSPNAVRPWQFVLEPLDGYLTLAEHLWNDGAVFADAWNFGPDPTESHSVDWIARTITGLWGESSIIETDGNPQPPETAFLTLDMFKTASLLRWHPVLPLEEALRWTVDWYDAYRSKKNMRTKTMEQIAQYSSKGSV